MNDDSRQSRLLVQMQLFVRQRDAVREQGDLDSLRVDVSDDFFELGMKCRLAAGESDHVEVPLARSDVHLFLDELEGLGVVVLGFVAGLSGEVALLVHLDHEVGHVLAVKGHWYRARHFTALTMSLMVRQR